MKPSILVVMLDFLVCSLLLFVIGTGGKQSQFATAANPGKGPVVAEEYSSSAIEAMQEEWNRDYEQQLLLTQLNAQTSENDQLRGRLNQTTATLADREANLKVLAEEKARVEQAKLQTEQSLNSVGEQLARVSSERQKLQQEGDATKENLAKLQTEFSSLQTQQSKLQQEKAELHERAQQLGQTVASQQSTISTLTEEVRASQARMETQLVGVARDQQAMVSSLNQLNELTKTLPAAIKESASSVHDEQRAMQEDIAALAESVKGLQPELSAEERTRLMQALADMAKGQQGLQSRMDSLIKAGANDQIVDSLNTIQTGQDALRQQTAKLGDQIESIKARKPGPFQAVKGARIELQVSIKRVDRQDATTSRFNAIAYPPVVRIDGRAFIVANTKSLGFNWWAVSSGSTPEDITELKYVVTRRGETAWSAPLTAPACALRADPHVVAVELDRLTPEINTMDLAGPEKLFQNDDRKLHVFKSSAAGLSFEIDSTPDLADARYLVIKRPLRGVAAWFENPDYRPDGGDYVVTSDGKLVGIMVSREKCFIVSKDNIFACALNIPLNDKQQFLQATRQLSKIK